jgi:hypothetical protein
MICICNYCDNNKWTSDLKDQTEVAVNAMDLHLGGRLHASNLYGLEYIAVRFVLNFVHYFQANAGIVT